MVAAAPLDRFVPSPDVRERFETTVRAPASIVMDVATNFDMQSLWPVRVIFRMRETVMRSSVPPRRHPQGLLREMQALGWAVLAEEPGGLVICGARCQPWMADVRFSPLPVDNFATYTEPDQVKIAWSLETYAVAAELTRFVHETRAMATDGTAWTKFRRYWRWARFGIVAIRMLIMPAVRRAAEKRWRADRGTSS